MQIVAPLPSTATAYRVGRFYTGRPSWRTRLRTLRRRLGERTLPLNDEEWLMDAARTLRRQRRAANVRQEPVRALRLVRRLPLVFLAADGRTSFRYERAPKNASSSVVYMLMQITGEADYYPWDEGKHMFGGERVLGIAVREKENGAKPKKPVKNKIILNEQQLELHQYASRFYYQQPVHPQPDIRFCLVRDPVERFVAACQGLMFKPYRDASRNGAELRCQPSSDINVYIAHAEKQKQGRGEGWRVLRSQKWFLGRAEHYTHIFAVRQLARVRDFLSELTQKPLTLPNINRTRRKQKFFVSHPAMRGLNLTMPPLTAGQRRRIENLYAADYEAFGKYF